MIETELETETEVESTHAFDRRMADRLEAALAKATAATEAEGAASEAVDTARGDHSLGLLARGQLLGAQRRLAAAQEAAATAQAAVRATERAIAREREARDAILRRQARAERQAREAERAASAARAREAWTEIFALLREIDGLPGIKPLSSAGAAYDRALAGLTNLRRHFNQ